MEMKKETDNPNLFLCGKMSLYKKGNKELLIFPDVPKWIITTEGAYKFLKEIDGMRFDDINAFDPETQEFIHSLIDLEILTPSNTPGNSKPIEKKEEIYPLLGVWLSVESLCNLKCKHCFLGDKSVTESKLSVKEIESLITEMQKVSNENGLTVEVTGGEPLLRKDILDILAVVNRKGIRPSMTTNGLLINDDIAKYLAKEQIVTKISLDGSNAETHEFLRGKGTFDRTIENIKKCTKKGVPVTLILTVHKGNQNYISDFFDLADNLGVKSVNLSFLNDFGYALENALELPDQLYVYKEILHKSLNDDRAFQHIKGTALSAHVEALYLPVKVDCCGSGINTCAIGANGDVYPCPSFQIEQYKAGNIRCKPFDEIWRDSKTFSEHRKINVESLNEYCSKCDVRLFCGGGCRAQAFFTCNHDLCARSKMCPEYKKLCLDIIWMLDEYPKLCELHSKEGERLISSHLI